MDKIKIGKRLIGEGEKTLIIAEIGLNHSGDVQIAKDLIVAAKKSGADAVKFQTYITEKRVPRNSPIYDNLKKCELTENETRELAKYADSEGIILFSTPFDDESVDLLIDLKVPLLKIASFDIVNHKLLEKVAKTKIPIIISRGMASIKEIDEAIAIFKKHDTTYALLHCVSAYPTKDEDANLSIIRTLMKKYDCPIGYSDHTLRVDVPTLSTAVGACIIEKHFTLDKSMEGADHKISCNPEELMEIVRRVRKVEKILGTSEIKPMDCEKDTLQYRRSS